MAGETSALGGRRTLIAVVLVALGVVPLSSAVRAAAGDAQATWLVAIAFFGTCALSLASGVLVPPGLAIPPPLWPLTVAGAVVIGLEYGAAHGFAAGALAGAIPLLSAALSVSRLTPETTGFLMAMLLASVAPAALAGAVSSLTRAPAAPIPEREEAPASSEAGASSDS